MEQKKFGCFAVGALVVLSIILVVAGMKWVESRPQRMLGIYLDLQYDDRIVQIESKLKSVGPFEKDANIYLEAEPALIRSVLVQGCFDRVYLGNEILEERTVSSGFLNFGDAPNADGIVSVLFRRERPGIFETIGTSEDFRQMWYVGRGY